MPPTKHWSENAAGEWIGKDDAGHVRAILTQYGQITLFDVVEQRPRLELSPNFTAEEGPIVNVQDQDGARVFAVFSTGKVTIGRIDRPIMRIDADGTIHVKPGAIVEDL